MNYVDLFSEQSILLDLQVSDSDSALAAMVDQMVANNAALAERKDELLTALIAREAQGSTGDAGVGMPHVKMAGITDVAVVVGIHKEGLDFAALDGSVVNVFFCVVRPEEGADEHLGLLRWLASIAKHEDFVSFSVQATEAQQVIDLLSELAAA
ncbi:MAG: PTS sugar transporter subunit IIA [Planctomycetota bacterium]|jgi:PTS system fructose-specific IIC component|nr:PTS sugar transporter subunit IIA [Planctomycetota bacterium]